MLMRKRKNGVWGKILFENASKPRQNPSLHTRQILKIARVKEKKVFMLHERNNVTL
jgi:hypothetical protein